MEKLHYLGLLFLNFAILNILLSIIFFLLSIAGKRFLSAPFLKGRLFFVSLVAPPALSVFTILTSFAPPMFIKIPGRLMFCLNAPYCYIFPFVSPEIPLFNGLLISAIVLVLIPVIYSIISIRSYLRVNATIDNLTTLNPHFPPLLTKGKGIPGISIETLKELKEIEDIHKIRVKVIDTPHMISFIWGYISNHLILSTGVLKRLSMDELRGLLAHELSHHKRRDNILKGILLLCRNSLFIFPHAYYMFRWWREEIELLGDETAALITGRPLDVASALLKMQSSPAPEPPPFPPFKKGGLRGIWGMGDGPYAIGFSISQNSHLLTERVERLVAIHDSKIRPQNERFPLIPSEIGLLISMGSLFLIFFIAIYEFNPLLVHCTLERLLSLI